MEFPKVWLIIKRSLELTASAQSSIFEKEEVGFDSLPIGIISFIKSF